MRTLQMIVKISNMMKKKNIFSLLMIALQLLLFIFYIIYNQFFLKKSKKSVYYLDNIVIFFKLVLEGFYLRKYNKLKLTFDLIRLIKRNNMFRFFILLIHSMNFDFYNKMNIFEIIIINILLPI